MPLTPVFAFLRDSHRTIKVIVAHTLLKMASIKARCSCHRSFGIQVVAYTIYCAAKFVVKS